MSIRFRKDRNKFELSTVVEGKRKRLLFQTKREALDCLARPSLERDSTSIEEAIQVYYRDVSSQKSRTSHKNEKRYFNLLFHFLTEEKGLWALRDVRYGHMLGFQNWLKCETAWSASTVNRAFNSIKDFFVYFVRDGELESSPCVHLEQLQAKPNVRRPMTGDEFLLALKKAPDWFKPAMAFMHLTAAAPSSIERLRWEDVGESQVIIARCKGSKGKWRRIHFPMTLEVSALLQAQARERHGFVFSNESSEPLRAAWISRLGNRAIRAAGVKGVVLYCVRHALASELTDANVSIEIVRQLMGHSNIRTTQGYAKPKTDSLANALTLVRGGKCHQDATSEDLPAASEIAT